MQWSHYFVCEKFSSSMFSNIHILHQIRCVFYHHHIKKDKATTFEYFYLKPFWLFDWSKLGSSGAVIR